MNGWDIAIIVIVSVAFVGVAGYLVYRKLKHKGGCDCGCDCCNCSACKGQEGRKDKN